MAGLCSKCGSPGLFAGKSKQCKKCRAAYKAAWYQQNKTAITQRQKDDTVYQQKRSDAAKRRKKYRQLWRSTIKMLNYYQRHPELLAHIELEGEE